jgi:hypothetical protein
MQCIAGQALACFWPGDARLPRFVGFQHVPRGTIRGGQGGKGTRDRPTAKAGQARCSARQGLQLHSLHVHEALDRTGRGQGGERRAVCSRAGRRCARVLCGTLRRVQGFACSIASGMHSVRAWNAWTGQGGEFVERRGGRVWEALLPAIRHNERRYSAINGGASRLNAGRAGAERAGV